MVRQVGWRHRLSEADIDELIQDVRIRLWRAHAKDAIRRGSESLSDVPASYVYRTATTAALDLIRRRRAGRAASHDGIETADMLERAVDYSLVAVATPDQEAETAELAAQVDRAIETIPASRRAVVRMYLAGYPREEIAEVMGWTEAKTRNLVYRGLSDLRACLTEWGIGWGEIKQ
jgi:RNA polymerase sigma-70 factor (ECF subfamily)